MTVGLIGQPAPSTSPGTFSFGLNWAIAYELPNATETAAFYAKKKYRKPVQQRRNRRDLYEKLETILDRYLSFCCTGYEIIVILHLKLNVEGN